MFRRVRLSELEQGFFTHVAKETVARARLFQVRWLPMGTAAMTFGKYVLIQRRSVRDFPLIAHELVHVKQWKDLGVVRFSYRYLKEYFAGRFQGLGHWEAYEKISFERLAREESAGLMPSAPETSDRPSAE